MLPFVEELKSLNLPEGSYAIFGSGPLAVRGLREAKDLDLLARKNVWDVLAKKYPMNEKGTGLQIGNIEAFSGWLPWFEDPNTLIDTAETIEGLPFVRLEHVVTWKRAMGREKDVRDLQLIEKYLNP